MNEKFVQLAEPEQLEEYLFTACGQTAVLYHAELAAALALLPEQTQEEIFRYYFLRQPQREMCIRDSGRETSHSLNYQKLGRELMSMDDLATLDGNKCILQVLSLIHIFRHRVGRCDRVSILTGRRRPPLLFERG